MAKKKPTSRADAVRQAVDQAFQTQIPRERIGELLDELGNTAGRLRGAVDELRPASAEEVRTLRADVRALTARVDKLEAAAKPKPARKPAAKPAAKRSPAAKPRKRAAAKPPSEGS
jgi:class 3 adenylate cyclase